MELYVKTKSQAPDFADRAAATSGRRGAKFVAELTGVPRLTLTIGVVERRNIRPSWAFEGWAMKSGFDPYDEAVRVRVVLDREDGTSY
ncbi:MAG TPA: hypothetical protein VJM46_03310 [Candidatus Saccharimonadales bacterium]|nr:hypothetical protein [Candidatus Saccharimonadales bacterium]